VDRAASTQTFIVARRHPELYDYLSARFADDPNVTVVLDRRLATRRRRALPAAAERRRVDRRLRPDVDQQLRATSLAVVTASSATATAAAPASEARQWAESMHRGIKAVQGALDAHEQLQVEAQSVKREHDRLQHRAQALEQENERLRAQIDHSRKELAELDARLSRAIEVVTDLHSRLNKEPDRDPIR
jgi:septal ring factor EnvC (AmiA/AmiB activator)